MLPDEIWSLIATYLPLKDLFSIRLSLPSVAKAEMLTRQGMLALALQFGSTAWVADLLAAGWVDPGADDRHPGWPNSGKWLRDLFFDASTDVHAPYLDNVSLRWASYKGQTEIVRLLLADHRVDPTTQGDHYPLLTAVYHGHTEIVRLLLADGRSRATLNHLRLAARGGHAEIVRLLWTTPRENTVIGDLFMDVAEGGHAEIMAFLLSRQEIPIRTRITWANVSLLSSAQQGHTDVVRVLLVWLDQQTTSSFIDIQSNKNLALALADHEAVMALLRE